MISSVMADQAEVTAILDKWDAAVKEWKAAYEFAGPEQRRILIESQPNPDNYSRALWTKLKPVLNSPESLRAVTWIMNNIPSLVRTLPPQEQKKAVPMLLDAIEENMLELPGVGKLAHSLAISSDARCRRILGEIRVLNKNPKDQGMAALGLAISLREEQGILKDDLRSLNVRAAYLKEAILKCYDDPFGNGVARTYCDELLYEMTNLAARQKAPRFSLKSSDGTMVQIPNGEPTLLVFSSIDDERCIKLLSDADLMEKKFPGLKVVPVCPMTAEKAQKDLPLHQLPVPVLLDEKGAVFKQYRVASIPYVYFLDKNGVIGMRGMPDFGFETSLTLAMKPKDAAEDDKPSNAPRPAVDPTRRTPIATAPSRPIEPEKTDAPGESGHDPVAPPPLRPLPED